MELALATGCRSERVLRLRDGVEVAVRRRDAGPADPLDALGGRVRQVPEGGPGQPSNVISLADRRRSAG